MPIDFNHHVEQRPIDLLKTARRNARTHSEAQVAQIASAIATFGFINPILVDAENRVVAGHGRLLAAEKLGLASVPTLKISHLNKEELRAYALADNKIALNSGWDAELLKLELGELAELDAPFDIEVTGFSTPELDLILDPDSASEEAADELPSMPRRGAAVTQRGDLWRLGEHRLLCGDSREPASFQQVMRGDQARLVFSDPPYNVPIGGHVGGLGAVQHAEFAMASGEMSSAEFVGFLERIFANARAVSVDGALHYQCMDWRHMREMLDAGEAVYSDLKNLCVWAKDNGGMGSLYRSRHELVFVWKVGSAPHINNVELGRHGRYRTNVWEYRGASKSGANAELNLHPTVKPVAMIVDAIKDASRRGDVVLDAFGGSGSTLIAAEIARRQGRLIEYEPGYCDVTVQRWQQRFGRIAVLEATGESFAEVQARRIAEVEARADAALAEEVL